MRRSIKQIKFKALISSRQRSAEPVLESRRERARLFTYLDNERIAAMRRHFGNDAYPPAPVSFQSLPDCTLHVDSGLLVGPDGVPNPCGLNIAKYYIDPARATDLHPSTLIEEPVAHVFHRSCGAYGHFILDGLCAIAMLRADRKHDRLKILMPGFHQQWAFRALRQIGLDESKLIVANGVVRCRELVVSSTVGADHCFRPDPHVLDALRDLVAVPHVKEKPTRKIFIIRGASHSPRFTLNEGAVISEFQARGFEVINPATMTFRDQIERFSQARIIAGAHGSGLANMVFMPRGGEIIDLMPEHWVGYFGPNAERWLLNLTRACGHGYSLVLSPSVITGPPRFANPASKLPRIESTVDLTALCDALAEQGLLRRGWRKWIASWAHTKDQ